MTAEMLLVQLVIVVSKAALAEAQIPWLLVGVALFLPQRDFVMVTWLYLG